MTNEQVSRGAPSSGGRDLARRFTTLFGPISRPLAGRRWFRLWAVLHHVGRTSGRAYAIPVVARRTADGFVIPLPFGEGTQWVRNLQAAGGGTLRWDGRDHAFVDPVIVDADAVAADFGGFERAIMRRAGASFVRVHDAPLSTTRGDANR